MIESLEQRTLLSAASGSITLTPQGELVVTGCLDQPNAVRLELRQHGMGLTVRLNDQVRTVPLWRVRSIQIIGGKGDDSITVARGIKLPAQIWGKGGNDTIYGGGGDDALYGGPGSDVLHGRAGNDILRGGAGWDQLFGEAGHDQFWLANVLTWLRDFLPGSDSVHNFVTYYPPGGCLSPDPDDLRVLPDDPITLPFPWEDPTEPVRALAQMNNEFAWDMYAQLSQQAGDVFFSPLSISAALAMTAAGAKGDTLAQMMQVLHLQGDPDEAFGQLLRQVQIDLAGHPELHLADAFWAQNGMTLQDAFVDALTSDYLAQAGNLNFGADPEAARQLINDWVAGKTNQKITDLLPPDSISATTRMVLVNAIYFLGKWASPFDPANTHDGQFTELSGQTTTIPLMNQKTSLIYFDGGTFQAVDMPYACGDQSMMILLPKAADGLSALESQLTAANVQQWIGQMQQTEIALTLPKFNITTDSISLGSTLQQLGMTDAFTSGADFSGITTDEHLQISNVYHKAYITVAEGGTEAAAATGVVLGNSCDLPAQTPVQVRADHPFVFIIRDTRTGQTLFAGRVENPVAPTAAQALPG